MKIYLFFQNAFYSEDDAVREAGNWLRNILSDWYVENNYNKKRIKEMIELIDTGTTKNIYNAINRYNEFNGAAVEIICTEIK